ncbi:hypothetical protein SDC9_113150 [bioreactor metagenome]|uniref:Uncharacterized protein n=1 Tax=bioreactor metagenome TaxID=1076179 RepID=A0A645BSN3_9ZZZZ
MLTAKAAGRFLLGQRKGIAAADLLEIAPPHLGGLLKGGRLLGIHVCHYCAAPFSRLQVWRSSISVSWAL